MREMSKLAIISFNDIPAKQLTFKYEFLGAISSINHENYCRRHGYDYISDVEIDRTRPACWSKILAVLKALKTYEWVLWIDSDTLFSNVSKPADDFCDPAFDLIAQEQEFWWELIGLPNGTDRFPINSGVFLIRSTPWSVQFLNEAYRQVQFVSCSELWNGIGDQEAMNHVIRANPEYRMRIGYKNGLQISPRLYTPDYLLIHFYGNRARHYLSIEECNRVFVRWELAIRTGKDLPGDLLKLHWCCIQNKDPRTPFSGDLDHYMYKLWEICK